MKKIAIFNVGGALSTYVEFDDLKFVVDIGVGNGFSPVKDFLIPLAERRSFLVESGKYQIDQLFLSHLDNDHISDYENFTENFHPKLLTVPSDHEKISEKLKISRDKISKSEIASKILEDMKKRIPGGDANNPDYENPLAVCDTNNIFLDYISPKECEQLDLISEEDYPHYANNISLVLYVKIGNSSILFPGDIMKDGMECLIKNKFILRSVIYKLGVDFIIAPHHGLDTSFSDLFFKTIKDKKVKLNIISEKSVQKEESDNRHNVDRRYYSSDYSSGVNVLNGKEGIQYGIITSLGHIVIDFDQENPIVKRCKTNEELLNEFKI